MDAAYFCFFLLCRALELVHLRDPAAEVIVMSLRVKPIVSGIVMVNFQCQAARTL